MNNIITTIKNLLKNLNVEYSQTYLEDIILSHPDYPSLLSISDTLEKYKIETLGVKINFEKLLEVRLSCIVQLNEYNDKVFCFLNSISNTQVSYFNYKNKLVKIPKNEFIEKWTGICLMAEKSEKSKEPGIELRLREKRFFSILKIALLTLLFTWGTISFLNSEVFSDKSTAILYATYAILKIVGLILSGLLLWHEVDQFNPTLQSFCSAGGKINCSAVLNSKHAKILNGSLSLSLLAFTYFFSTLFYILFSSFSITSISLLGYLSLLSTPVILLSLYYQVFVIKQRCRFCIGLQVVLSLEVIIAYWGDFLSPQIFSYDTFLLGVFFLTPILVWKLIKPLLDKKKEMNFYKRGLKKIKNNPNVFQGLLSKSRKITNPPNGLGITIKNSNVKYNILKVCNPYCNPCAKAHLILDELYNRRIINLQMVFTAHADEEDVRYKPVSHFLAIDEKDTENTLNALDDWYTADKKEYKTFSEKYPINGELKKQMDKVGKMRDWCNKENIKHTPTIFINGFELPNEYNIEDLSNLLM